MKKVFYQSNGSVFHLGITQTIGLDGQPGRNMFAVQLDTEGKPVPDGLRFPVGLEKLSYSLVEPERVYIPKAEDLDAMWTELGWDKFTT